MAEDRVVVGYDGSSAAQYALLWAAGEAARRDVELVIAHADEGDLSDGGAHSPDVPLSEELIKEAVATVIDTVSETGVSTVVRKVQARHLLVELSHEATLLVIGTRSLGWVASTLLASATYHVAARAHCPVVVVGDHHRRHGEHQRGVAVGVSPRPSGVEAVEFAFAEAAIRGVPVHAVRSWLDQEWDIALAGLSNDRYAKLRAQQAELLRDVVEGVSMRRPGVEVVTELSSLPIHAALMAAAQDADLLVLGCRYSADGTFPRVGPITSLLIQRSPCPVVVVGQHRTSEAAELISAEQ
jgi:nucleotide-binding universal stress UspA family protein